MNKEEFELQYAQQSRVTVEWLHKHGRYGAPCTCGEDCCEGWAMLYSDDDDKIRLDEDNRGGVKMFPVPLSDREYEELANALVRFMRYQEIKKTIILCAVILIIFVLLAIWILA